LLTRRGPKKNTPGRRRVRPKKGNRSMLQAALHVALSRAQGADMARRWSPENRIRLPTPSGGGILELRDVENYV